MDVDSIQNILDHVELQPGWRIIVAPDENRVYLQVGFMDTDNYSGEFSEQRGRKWMLSQHMTKSEIVATALKAYLTAMEHEARETFRYRGKAIFGPHFDVDALVGFAGRKANLDMRTGAWV
jgi:hypothetical protein